MRHFQVVEPIQPVREYTSNHVAMSREAGEHQIGKSKP